MYVLIEYFGDTLIYEYSELQKVLDHIKKNEVGVFENIGILKCYYSFERGNTYIHITDNLSSSKFGYVITGVNVDDQDKIETTTRNLFSK